MENYLKIKVLKIKFENWHIEKLFENRIFLEELNLRIGILENYLKIKVLKIKFENWHV